MTQIKILVVCLNPVIQKVIIFNKFEINEVNRAKESYWCASGKGVNTCRVLNHLGCHENILFTQNNGKHSEWFSEMCEKDQIHLHSLSIGGIRFCTTILSNGNATEMVEEGIPITKNESEKIMKEFLQIVENNPIEYVIFIGSTAPGISLSLYKEMTYYSHQYKAKVIADIRGESLQQVISEIPFIIKPNENEFLQTFGSFEKAIELSQKGINIIITRGNKSTYFYQNGQKFEIPIESIENVINPIGCGDSFTAGLVYSLLQKNSIQQAIHDGHKAASQNLQTIIPGSLL